MKTLAAITVIAAAEAAVLLALLVATEPTPQHPRFEYADHTYWCSHCCRQGADLCPEGERLRRLAVAHDGLRDPGLDR